MNDRPLVSRRGVASLLVGAASGLLLPARARAAALQITPILIELAGGARTSTVQVENRGGGATTMQVRVFAWTQPPDTDKLTETTALVASPPIFSIPEGATQIVRVVLLAPPGASEQAYRLLLDEIPGPAQGTAVVVALRVSLPVFAIPASAPPAVLKWNLETGPDGKPRLSIANVGGRYARIADLKLTLPNGVALPMKQIGQTPYVLPHAERHWTIDDSRHAIRPGISVMVTGTSNAGPLREKLSLNG
jgi:fimbrial chaperone protein